MHGQFLNSTAYIGLVFFFDIGIGFFVSRVGIVFGFIGTDFETKRVGTIISHQIFFRKIL